MSNFQEQSDSHYSNTNESSSANGKLHQEGEADVWFIDNDLAYRFLFRCELELNPIGGKLRMFDDGDRALMKLIEICTKNKAMLPKAIFTNIDSNRVGGWELVQTLKEFELEVDVVLFSTHPTNSDYERMNREPLVKDVVLKRHDPSNILEKMKRFASMDKD